MLNNIPDEMKAFDQWIVWRFENVNSRSKPTKVPYSPRYGTKASVTDRNHWGNFADACVALNSGMYSGLGFVLTEEDPYGFIDLDDPWQLNEAGAYIHADPQYVYDQQIAIYNAFDSFAEYSPSKKGVHIIVRSPNLPSGRKRASVELYTSGRYMTMTGDVMRQSSINEYGELLRTLYDDLGGPAAIENVGVNVAQTEDDATIIQRALGATNGEKFKALCEGRWQDYGYPSPSEADFAIIDIFAFYTQNRIQVERLFKSVPAYRGEKYDSRDNLIQYMINRAFDRQLPPVDTDALLSKLREIQASTALKRNGAGEEGTTPAPALATSLEPGGTTAQSARAVIADTAPPVNELPFPPGIIGDVAQFIYDQAPRPVRQIALAGAIGFIAGLAGRAYNVSAAGLNQYVMLIAPTGTGKEAINSGISKLEAAIRGNVIEGEGAMPFIDEFIGPGEIRSDAALLKWCGRTPCFYSIIGEVGLRLKQMSAPNASPSEVGLKKVLLDLYNKSGFGNSLGAMAYSDKDKTTERVLAPAFTLIGESTPERFYDILDESMIAEGLLPRFLTIEYMGNRPPRSDKHETVKPDKELVRQLRNFVGHCKHLMEPSQKPVNVPYSKDARDMLDAFDKFCDSKINEAISAGGNAVVSHMWNRGHVKALKLAALVSVGISPTSPVIDVDCAGWAIDVVVRDITNVIGRFERGEVGAGVFGHNEAKQHKDVVKFVRRYYSMTAAEANKKYGVPEAIFNAGLITYSALNKGLSAIASFRNGKLTPTLALKNVIQAMIDADELRELPRSQMTSTYNTTARAFAISNASLLA